jgi:glycosyltransferase involved in cell wall biosynthesis
MSDKKILCVNYTAYLGGSTVVAARSAAWLNSQRYRVIMASPPNRWLERFCNEHSIIFEPVAIAHLRPFTFPWFKSLVYARNTLNAALHLRTLYKKYHCSYYYFHCLPNLAALLGALLCHRRPVWHIHEIEIHPPVVFKLLQTIARFSAARLVVPASAVATQYPDGRTTVIPGVVPDTPVASTEPPQLNAFKEQSARRTTIVWVGGIEPRKGLSEALAELQSALPLHGRIAVAVIATCNSRYSDLKKSIEQQIAQMPFPAQLICGQSDPQPWLHFCDIALQTSRLPESFGLTLIEAMANRCAVICTNRGGSSDFIVDNENALVYNPDTPGDLTAALTKAVANQQIREGLTANAQRTVQHFSADTVYPALLRLFS